MEKRRIISYLPDVLKTEPMEKLFGATADHLFQPGSADNLSGYIGSRDLPYLNVQKDFYLPEIRPEREAHQLDAAMVSFTTGGALQNSLFYDDLVSYLGSQGAITSNHNRLFEAECYSWAPPLDIDKLSNFGQYYWFGDNSDEQPALVLTAPRMIYTGDGSTALFGLPNSGGMASADEHIVVFVNGVVAEIALRPDADSIILATPPAVSAQVMVFRHGDLRRAITGKMAFDASSLNVEGVTLLTNGIRVILHDALNAFQAWDMEGWDTISWDVGVINDFYVEGVGASISLHDFNKFKNSNTISYVVMSRTCRDENPWANANRWVHREAISWRAGSFLARRATRPILEFTANLKLWKYGTHRLPDVQAVVSVQTSVRGWDIGSWDNSTEFADDPWDRWNSNTVNFIEINGEIEGSILADWQPWMRDRAGNPLQAPALQHGQRVIVVNVSDNDLADAIYRVSIVQGRYLLVAETVVTGGEIVRLNSSNPLYPDKEFYHDGNGWVEAQTRGYQPSQTVVDPLLAPLFELFDGDSVSLADIGRYPDSDFDGNRIFSYATSTTSPTDAVLGLPLRRDSSGQIVFEVDSVTRRTRWGAEDSEITGFYYHKISGETSTSDVFGNNWTVSNFGPLTEKKPTLRHHFYDNGEPRFPIPDEFIDAQLDVYLDGVSLASTEYTVNGNRLTLKNSPVSGTTVLLAFHGDGDVYEVPLNMRANPLNDDVEFISRSQWFEHFASLLTAQDGFVGQPFSVNNWRDIAHNFGLGRRILQHRAPLLKTMLMASDLRFDLPSAIRYAAAEYERFRARFLTRAATMLRNGEVALDATNEQWVEAILSALRQNRTSDLPFATSGVAGDRYYVPPTPSALGVLPVYRPFLLENGVRGHDGSITPLFGDFRDGLLLALEQRIYDSIPADFRDERLPAFDVRAFVRGRFRNDHSNLYSREEFTKLIGPTMERWAQINQKDYRARGDFRENDPWTWNYSGCVDQQGNSLPGHWRGIYRWFFGTDRPDLRPWEMLGFVDKPDWWEDRYGPAPYTRDNAILWEDIEEGNIFAGPRQGTDACFARPGLMTYLPIDSDGALLDPISAAIVTNAPTYQDASAKWKIGDHGDVEEQWLSTPGYCFSLALAGYLMKPARMVESCWDSLSNVVVQEDQWVMGDGWRIRTGEALLHSEYADDGITRTRIWGIQQWITDHMASRGQDAANFGQAVRGLNVRLGHKVGGFTTTDNLRIVADNFGLVPDEDIRVDLYRSPSIRDEVYTAVIVEWEGSGWRVVGYDPIDPNFTIELGDPNGPKKVIRSTDADEPSILLWRPNVHYRSGSFVSYQQSVYEAIRTHMSGPTFEQTYWSARPDLAVPSSSRVINYLQGIGEEARIPYGSVLRSIQDVADLLLGLGRWQNRCGWRFVDSSENDVSGWEGATKQFLLWATSRALRPGEFIALTPAATHLRYVAEHGSVLDAERTYRGIYGLIDMNGLPIDARDTLVRRLDGEISFDSIAGKLFCGARVSIGEVEHTILFSNKTIFGDTIYDPLYDLRQPRLRILGQRSTDWKGRFDAPGYMIVDGQIKPNFEKQVDDVRRAFGIERADNKTLRDYARHVIGYESRSYMRDLFLSDTQQFEFYQGMIQAKGVSGVFDKLVRSQFVDQDRNLQFYDEWAFKVGEYGARSTTSRFAIQMRHSDVHRDPQFVLIRDAAGNKGDDDWFEIIGSSTNPSPLWIENPKTSMLFPQREDYSRQYGGLPSAGYARLDEVISTAFDMTALGNLFDPTAVEGGFPDGSRYWVYNSPNNIWEIFRTCAIGRISSTMTNDDDPNVNNARIVFYDNHGLTDDDVGSFLVIGPNDSLNDLEGVREITRVGVNSNWIEVDVVLDNGREFGDEDSDTQGPQVGHLRSVRFSNQTKLQESSITWNVGEIVYVDGDEKTLPWTVRRWNGSQWDVIRVQPKKIKSSSISNALVYDTSTRITANYLSPEPLILKSLVIVDPIGGLIAGVADREISYKTDYDPAKYGRFDVRAPGNAWSSQQVGEMWWNISTVRFLDVETDDVSSDDVSQSDRYKREMRYRADNFGRVAPGSTVDVYEWVSSDVPPSQWTDEGIPLSDGDDYLWSEESSYDEITGIQKVRYYFWVKGRSIVPSTSKNRHLSSVAVANIITNPANLSTAWFSPVSINSFLVGGISSYLDDDGTALQVSVKRTDYDGVVHHQWSLLRERDEKSLPSDGFWNRLRDSLAGFDDRLRSIPDPALHHTRATGLLPNQSLFGDGRSGMFEGRRSFVQMANVILSRTDIAGTRPLALDAFRSVVDVGGTPVEGATPIDQYMIWAPSTNDSIVLPVPPKRNNLGYGVWDYEVGTIEERNALLFAPEIRSRTTPVRVLVNGISNLTPQWSVYTLDLEALELLNEWSGSDEGLIAKADDHPGENPRGFFRLEKRYDDPDHIVDTISDMRLLTNALEQGERVLVRSDVSVGGFWSVWKHQSGSFSLVETQTYRLGDFWDYADWYADGYSANDPPTTTYMNVTDRNLTESPETPLHRFVLIQDDGTGRWMWTAWNDGVWAVVARQNGTILLSEKLFDETREPYGLDGRYDASLISNRDGSWEMRIIVDALRRLVLTDAEINELFFSMLHCIHAQQNCVDWAFKTNFMSVSGYREPLSQTPVATQDNTGSIISYINEVKPYRVKIRRFDRSLAAGDREIDGIRLDLAETRVSDFDKPPYWDEATNSYRRLMPENILDREALMSQPWRDWMDNYLGSNFNPGTVGYNPVRHMKVTLKFDRVTQSLASGWNTANVDTYTASERIEAFYEPEIGMPEKNRENLLGIGFAGTEYQSVTMQGSAERDVDLDGMEMNDDGDAEVDATGFRLRDPHNLRRRPEEAASAGANVAIGLLIDDRTSASVPQASRIYHVEDVTDNAVSINLPLIAQGGGAVAIFRDGYRAVDGIDYGVNIAHQTASVSMTRGSNRVRRIVAHVFAPGATTSVVGTQFYTFTGGAPQFTIKDEYVGLDVEVVVDGGRLLENQFSVVGNLVTLGSSPNINDDIILVYRLLDEDDATAPVRIETRTQLLSYVPEKAWSLSYPSEHFPAHEATIAELNGRRLSPPDTQHAYVDSILRTVETRRAFTQPNIRVYLDEVLQTVFDGNIYETMEIALSNAPLSATFVLRGTTLHTTNDEIIGDVLIVGYGYHEYTVSQSGMLYLATNMTSGDRLTATTFVNDENMRIRTIVMDARNPVPLAPPPRPDACWVTLDGLRIEAEEDFSFGMGGLRVRPDLPMTVELYPGTGWDTWGMEDERWDLAGSEIPNDIVATVFYGKPTTETGKWIVHTKGTNDGLLLRRGETNSFTFNERVIEASRLRLERSGVLINDLGPNDSEIEISVGSDALIESMTSSHPFPLPFDNNPGAIWIGKERIEYFSIVRTGDTVTLSELRRATHGTSRGEIRIVETFEASGIINSFTLVGAGSATNIEVSMSDQTSPGVYEDPRSLTLGLDFNVTLLGDDVAITILGDPPLNGTFITIARTIPTTTHLAGEIVYGGTPAQISLEYILNKNRGNLLGEPYDDFYFHTDGTGFVS